MSTHGIQWYASCVKTASLDALATDWKADILRISMYVASREGGYETDPRKFTDMVHGYIEEATKRGMYALVDWHQLDPGDPNVYTAKAKTFFARSPSGTRTRRTSSTTSPTSRTTSAGAASSSTPSS